MKKAYINRDVLYVGEDTDAYKNGQRYNLDIIPFTGVDSIGEEDNRYMAFKSTTEPTWTKDPGYRVYPSVEDVSKDFKR